MMPTHTTLQAQPWNEATMRQAAYRARLALRSNAGPDAYLKRHRLFSDAYAQLVRDFVRVLPPLLSAHCIAKAEALAIEQLQKEPHAQTK